MDLPFRVEYLDAERLLPCWFEKQPERQSRKSAKVSGEVRRARAERKSKDETLVSERQDGSEFPFQPYTGPDQDRQDEGRRACDDGDFDVLRQEGLGRGRTVRPAGI
jgi:hypothetical protein